MVSIHLQVPNSFRTPCGLWADAVDKRTSIEDVTCRKCVEAYRPAGRR